MSEPTPADDVRPAGALVVRGARTHNLKGVDLTLPHRQLIVFTGVSGSGKSSLAFDTIYAEGQRRYVESLSAYARQFLERMEKPDVDAIDGIAPAIAIRQKNSDPESAVDRRHDDRDSRLPAAALGAGRPDDLPALREGGRARIARSRRRRAAGAAGRHPTARGLRLSRSCSVAIARRRAIATRKSATTTRLSLRTGRRSLPSRRGSGLGAAIDTLAPPRLRPPAGRRSTLTLEEAAAEPERFREATSPDRDRRSPARRSGGPLAADRLDRDRLPRRGRRGVRHRGGRCRRAQGDTPVQRAIRMPELRHPVRGSAAAVVLVQQPVRRVPDLPRLRQHHRARHEPGRARRQQDDQ